MISPTKITSADFASALSRYPALIESISEQKASKSPRGEKSVTLADLDELRFVKLPNQYSKDVTSTPKKALSKDDLVDLISWKLKHGTFRPTIMGLVMKNSDEDVEKITEDAFAAYDKFANVETALTKLTKLKGVGPATASLILATHDATRIVFFGDEVYVWLSGTAKKDIKYNAKEYLDLVSKSKDLMEKLDVDARDVEKVGFVLVHEDSGSSTKTKETPAKPEKSAAEVAARKLQLQEMAAKGRAEKVAKQASKQATKDAKGAAFRARIDAAREKAKKDGTYVVKEKPAPSGRPRGRPPGSSKRAASETDQTAAAKRPKRA